MQLKIFLAGRVAVETDGRVIGERRFPGRQGRLMFAYLVAEQGRPVPRHELADALWGEAPPARWDKALTVIASKLRVLLGDAGIDGASALTGAFGCYRLVLPEGTWVDAIAAANAAREAQGALARGDLDAAKGAAALALSLVRHPFLPGEDGSWVEEKRRQLTGVRVEALNVLADSCLRSGEAPETAKWAEQAIDLEPYRETGYRRLMEAHVAAGNRAEALRVYERCRRLLDEELGAYPSPETESVYQVALEAPSARVATRPASEPRSPTDAQPVVSADGLSKETASRYPRRDDPIAALTPRAKPPRSVRSRQALLAAGAGALVLAAATVAGVVKVVGNSAATATTVSPNSVAAIDTRTDRVVAQVGTGARPRQVVDAFGSLWVANSDDRTVSRVDPRTLQTLRTISVGGAPTGIAAAGGKMWVTSSASANYISVSRIDPQFDTIERTARIGNVVAGSQASVAARGDALWVAPYAGELSRIDPHNGRIIKQVDPNAGPAGISLGAGEVWVTDRDANSVTRVDPSGLVTSLAVGHGASGIAVGDGAVWVADTGDNAIVRIDPSTRAVTGTIPVGRAPTGVALGARSVWVANSGDGTVSRIDPRAGKTIATIAVGGSPQALSVAGGRAWVTVDAPTLTAGSVASTGGSARLERVDDVDFMDPALAYYGPSFQLLYATCAKLLNYPDKRGAAGSQLVPEVAQSLPARSADGRTYTFTMRRGFRFSPPSNEPVTAQTFKDTIERTLNPKMRNPVAGEFDDIVGARAYMAGKSGHISGVVARGNTLTVRLTVPAADLPARLAQPFFCAVPSNTPIDPNGVRVIPAAGPYRVASYTPSQGVVLMRNPNYHGSRPHRLARVEMAVGIPGQRAIADVEAGAADYAMDGEIGRGDAPRLAARYGAQSPATRSGRQQYFVSVERQLDFFALNTHRPLFSDRSLRRAVNYAVDRTALARLGSGGVPLPGSPADHYVTPGIPGYSDMHIYRLTPDLEEARRLAKRHLGARAVLYTCNQSPCQEQAQVLKTDLAAIGIQVAVKAFPAEILFDRLIRPREPFDIAYVPWVADYPDPAAMLNLLLESGTVVPTFDDPSYRARLAVAARLSGAKRYLTYTRLDADLTRHAAPWIAFGNASSHELFSARMGCQTYGVYGLDLAALCVRK